MGSLQISLPDSLRSFIDSQVELGGYGSADDYVCSVLRREQRRKSHSGRAESPGDNMDRDPLYLDAWQERHRAIEETVARRSNQIAFE